VLIGVGLTIVLMQFIWATIPIATAVALVALGATITTVRISRNTYSPLIVSVHLFVYASLYLLIVAAICDAAFRSSHGGLTLTQLVDLAASTGVMALATRRCVADLIPGDDGPTL
jgi:hypothetical protein